MESKNRPTWTIEELNTDGVRNIFRMKIGVFDLSCFVSFIDNSSNLLKIFAESAKENKQN